LPIKIIALKKIYILFTFIFFSAMCFAQVMDEFQQQLNEDSAKRAFASKLLSLNKLLQTKPKWVVTDSLIKDTAFTFLDKKLVNGQNIMIFDLTTDQKDVLNNLQDSGKIKFIDLMRSKGEIKVSVRGIANEVELPVKTNPRQSYNDFYLAVIKNLMWTNREILKEDKLDFAVYQSWEKNAKLATAIDIRLYRESFIRFLYKKYKII
jgi:hypothetical protein